MKKENMEIKENITISDQINVINYIICFMCLMYILMMTISVKDQRWFRPRKGLIIL